jgi:hypothetical protein
MYLYHERYDFSQRLPTAYVDFNTFPVEDIIVIYNGRYIDRRRYSRRNEDNTFSTHFSALANFFIDGATIKFCSLQKKANEVNEICNTICNLTNLNCNINCYISPPDSIGALSHTDSNYSAAIQLAGSKNWIFTAENGKIISKFNLTFGDIIAFSPKAIHATNTTDDFSIHWTISIQGAPTDHDILNISKILAQKILPKICFVSNNYFFEYFQSLSIFKKDISKCRIKKNTTAPPYVNYQLLKAREVILDALPSGLSYPVTANKMLMEGITLDQIRMMLINHLIICEPMINQ